MILDVELLFEVDRVYESRNRSCSQMTARTRSATVESIAVREIVEAFSQAKCI